MRKIVVTFTIALSLGAASTIANAQPAAPATNASAAASTTAAANNNQTTAAKTSGTKLSCGIVLRTGCGPPEGRQ